MSDTSNTTVRGIKEATPGTTPANPILRTFCHTGSGLGENPVTQASQRICGRSDSRAPEAPRHLGSAPAGEISFEMLHDLGYFYDGLLQKAWTEQASLSNLQASADISSYSSDVFTTAVAGTDFEAGSLLRVVGCGDVDQEGVYLVDSSDGSSVTLDSGPTDFGSLTDCELRRVGKQGASGDIVATVTSGNALTSTTEDFTNLGVAVGDWVKIGGSATANQFATAAVNGWCRVSVVAANRLSFDRVPTGWVADAGTGKTIRIFVGDSINDDRDKFAYTLQTEYVNNDGTSTFRNFPGQYPGTFSISGENRENAQVITGSMGFIGISDTDEGASQISGAREVPASLAEPFNSGNDVARIAEGGTVITDADDAVVNFSLSIENNNSRLGAWGNNTGVGVRSGDLNISGTLETYFNDTTRLTKSKNQTSTSIDTVLTDSVHNYATVIDMPMVKLTGDPPPAGRNGVHTVPYNFTAHPDPELNYAIKLQRFWAFTDA